MTTSEDTLFHVDPPEPVRHWLIVGRDEPYIEKHGDDPDDPARTYAIECSDSKRCPGFIECLEDHTGAPDYDDTGDDEAVIHGVDHTYHYGYGWTVPYPGCVVQGVAFWGDDHLHIAKERGLGRHELETEWDDEYCTLNAIDTVPTPTTGAQAEKIQPTLRDVTGSHITPDAPEAKEVEYRRTHSRDGYGLGSAQYPDNREGRRALARTWKRADR